MSNCEIGGLAEIYNIGPDHKYRVSINDLETNEEEAEHIRAKGAAWHESGAEQKIVFSLPVGCALFSGAGLKSAEEILGQKEVVAALLLGGLHYYDDGHFHTRFEIAEEHVALWFNGREGSNQKPRWVK